MTFQIIVPVAVAAAVILAYHFLKKQPGVRNSLHRRYYLQLIQLCVILLCAARVAGAVNPALNITSIVLRGSALVVAILGFAAQPVISDIICGLLISIHKPFEIGDRIIVDGQEPGIVEDITLRHTVLRIYDGLRIVIPNSQLNSKTVTNTSYRMKDRRGLHLRFAVSFDTDVQKAMDIIRDCVVESPYTLSIETDGIREDSGPVYFLAMGDSCLQLDTTIWVAPETNNYKAITDVNLRVIRAFREQGVEIPYPYFNVMEFQGAKSAASLPEAARKTASNKRHYRSNTVRIAPGESGLQDATRVARTFAERQNLDERAVGQLELLTEESVEFIQRLMDQTWREFWIEGTGVVYRLHIRFAAQVGSAEYKKLLDISSSGKNDAVSGLTGRIREAMLMGMKRSPEKGKESKGGFEWQLSSSDASEEEIGKSILGALASDIRVSVTSERVELIVARANL